MDVGIIIIPGEGMEGVVHLPSSASDMANGS